MMITAHHRLTAALDIARGIIRDLPEGGTIRATQLDARIRDYCDNPACSAEDFAILLSIIPQIVKELEPRTAFAFTA